jgi:hypothetical protein
MSPSVSQLTGFVPYSVTKTSDWLPQKITRQNVLTGLVPFLLVYWDNLLVFIGSPMSPSELA